MAILRDVLEECSRVPFDHNPDERSGVLLEALKRETDPHVLSYLVKVVSHLGGVTTLRILAPMLGHQDPRVVSNTLEAMVHTGDETVFTLALPLVSSDEPRVRATALAVLCKYDRMAAIEAMGHCLRSSNRPEDRRGALYALKAVGCVPVSVLNTLMEEIHDPEVQIVLSTILEDTAPSAMQKLYLKVKHKIRRMAGLSSYQQTELAAPPLRPGQVIGWAMAGVLLVLVLAAAWWRIAPPEEQIATLGDAQNRIRPKMVALGPIAQYAGQTVAWNGTVTEKRPDCMIVSFPGGTARVELHPGQKAPREGDLVGVSACVSGRSAMGLIYLKDGHLDTVRGGDSSGSGWDSIPDRSFLDAASVLNVGDDFVRASGVKWLTEAERTFELHHGGSGRR